MNGEPALARYVADAPAEKGNVGIQNIMKIENRDLLLIGIRLIGLWLIFHSVINLAQSAITSGIMYQEYRRAEARVPWQAPKGISENLAKELNEKWKMDDSISKFTFQMQSLQAWSKIPWDLFMVLIALYMCRSGKLIIRFLGGKEENPNQSAHTTA